MPGVKESRFLFGFPIQFQDQTMAIGKTVMARILDSRYLELLEIVVGKSNTYSHEMSDLGKRPKQSGPLKQYWFVRHIF
jgi:hypothetical protein